MRRRFLVVTLIVGIVTWAPAVHAEWLFDMYLGATITPKTTIGIEINDPLIGRVDSGDHIRFKDSVAVGGRIGHWFEQWKWLGVAADVERYRTDVPRQVTTNLSHAGVFNILQPIRAETVALNLDAMLRYPGLLPTTDVPNGSLQPYVTVGGGAYITHLEDVGGNLRPTGQEVTGVWPGFKLGAGIAWQFAKRMTIFTEYRYTQYSLSHDKADFQGSSFAPLTPFTAEVDLTVRSHHFLGGIGFRF